MKIAITDLKDYVEGILRYEWLDLGQYSTAAQISDFIEEFLGKRSKETQELHEEWFVTDYEEFVNMGEYPNLEDIEKAVSLGKQHGWEAVSAYYGMNGNLDDFEEAYNGIYDSEEDFAYEIAHEIYSEEDLGQLEMYIDWEKYTRDLFINDYFGCDLQDCKVVVFRRV